MNRVDTLRKLLAVGELHRSQIDLIMGGDKTEITHAMDELRRNDEIRMIPIAAGVQLCQLTDLARARAFAQPIETTVLVRQRVQIINFPEVYPC
jgi:uncharacterized protein with ACT and thioredoxin-like domain